MNQFAIENISGVIYCFENIYEMKGKWNDDYSLYPIIFLIMYSQKYGLMEHSGIRIKVITIT